jgi:hypothetical protein
MINYGLLHEASHYYTGLGYERIESPWLVTEAISNITKPLGISNYYVTKYYRGDYQKVFVASGEQSFLYLINKGFLPKTGKFQTITPCMRNDSFDETHSKYFMKLELINYSTLSDSSFTMSNVEDMSFHAMKFFESVTSNKEKLVYKYDEYKENMMDIMYNVNEHEEVELGSYGVRECSFVKWVYGTGLAEPRFSRTVKR